MVPTSILKNSVVAGPNGSGKTTFAESFFQDTLHSQIYLNPDIIALGFSKTNFQQSKMTFEDFENLQPSQKASFEKDFLRGVL